MLMLKSLCYSRYSLPYIEPEYSVHWSQTVCYCTNPNVKLIKSTPANRNFIRVMLIVCSH
jgi:hypothetical protein